MMWSTDADWWLRLLKRWHPSHLRTSDSASWRAGRGPVEATAERLGHQGSRHGVVPTFALVYVEEDVDALILLNAALEHTS